MWLKTSMECYFIASCIGLSEFEMNTKPIYNMNLVKTSAKCFSNIHS